MSNLRCGSNYDIIHKQGLDDLPQIDFIVIIGFLLHGHTPACFDKERIYFGEASSKLTAKTPRFRLNILLGVRDNVKPSLWFQLRYQS